MATIFTRNLASLSSTIPGRDITFAVTASSNYLPSDVSYRYQWQVNSTNVTGAVFNSYTIDPLMTDNGKKYLCTVVALSNSVIKDTVNSVEVTLEVHEDVAPFDRFDFGKETGRERHRRMRHLGYC